MKRGTYWIRCNREKEGIVAVKVNGHIIQDAASGLTFGARFVAGGGWQVTELSTGLLCSTYERKPQNAADIIPFIDRMRGTIVSAMRSHTDAKFFSELIEKACKSSAENA